MSHPAPRKLDSPPVSRGQVALAPDVVAQLLVRPARRAREQCGGHWLRVADVNGMADPSWLLGSSSRPPLSVVRVCPKCLAEPEPIWLEAWLDRSCPLCAEHQVWLIDECSACARPLRWNRLRFLSCRCDQDLRDLAVTPLTPAVRQAVMSDGVPLHVLLWLGALARYGLFGKPLKKASRRTMREVADLAELGADMVGDWPGSFFRALDLSRRETKGSASLRLLNEALPGLMKRIGKVRDTGWRMRITEALGAYAAAGRQTPSPLIGRNVPGHRPPSMASIAREFGVRPERLKAALDELPGVDVLARRTAGGRCRRVASPTAVASARRALADQISIKQAARLLGLSVPRTQQLVVDGKLPVHRRRLSRIAVVELQHSLTKALVPGRPPADAVTLGHALRYRIPVDRTGHFIKAIQTGEIAIYRSARAGLLAWQLVGEERVRTWVSMRPAAERDWLTIPECAERLKLKQQVVYYLVRVGVIATQTKQIDRRSARVVTAAALRDFEQQIEPLARSAARAGVDHRRGLAWARANDIELVSGPRIDGGRQYFVRRGFSLGNSPDSLRTRATTRGPRSKPASLKNDDTAEADKSQLDTRGR